MAFLIVSPSGQPVFELELLGSRRTSAGSSGGSDEAARGAQFILHAALDAVDAAVWTNKDTFLKAVDRHNEQLVFAYVTAGGLRLLLLHEGGGGGGVGGGGRGGGDASSNAQEFFEGVHELLVRITLNPFYTPGSKITQGQFEGRVRALARRHLGSG